MPKDLLLEIGMEEVPARFLRAAMVQLQEKVSKWLNENHIAHEEVKAFATPRRIAVLVSALAEKGADIQEEAKGPSKKIAMDDSGAWTKAALGFARGLGVEPDQMYFKELNGVEYVYATKSSIGAETATLLGSALTQIVTGMTFPKAMKWGAYELRFVRPIRWIVALFGSDVVQMEITGVTSGRVSKGHRFLGSDVEFASASDYVEAMRKQFVFVDVNEREALITKQINELASQKGWNISIKEDLLEEVLFLVEYPTALFGTFNPEFLNIPQDVLITSMREHQRYFPVLDDNGQLLPFFVTVRNGDSRNIDVVARGNEKVLRARLSDAKFFYEEDQKGSIEGFLSRLETIVYHEELGSIGDKVRRIGAIASKLANAVGTDSATTATVERIAALCKFDLVTQMVYEFPELQGVMGQDYANKFGESQAVSQGIFEHYQPRFSGEQSPASLAGALVSIADKMDTITGCFSIGIIPTGSQDPYALRRQAAGIVQIMLDHKLPLTLEQLFTIAIEHHAATKQLKRSKEEIAKDLQDFFALRVKNVLQELEIRYDVVDAVMAAGFGDVGAVIRKGKLLMNEVASPEFKGDVESFNRVNNLASKAETTEIQPQLFTEGVERELYTAWQSISAGYEQSLNAGQEDQSLRLLAGLKAPITAFFDKVMVMVDDQAVKNNRLALLSGISGDLKRFADFQKLVW